TSTLVLPPRSRLISILGLLLFQPPAVKSGTSIEFERLSTDHWLKGTMQLQAAASYTSMSSGRPLRRQSIRRQHSSKSVPPSLDLSCLAKSASFRLICGVYLSSRSLNCSGDTHLWLPTASRGGSGYPRAAPL